MPDIVQAAAVARSLLSHTSAKGAFIFGSIARNDTGNDLDLALIVPQADFQAFADAIYTPDQQHANVPSRYDAAYRVLRWDIKALERSIPGNQYLLDIFLLPVNWRRMLRELPTILSNHNSDFFFHLAADARVYHPRKKGFGPLPADPVRELRVRETQRDKGIY